MTEVSQLGPWVDTDSLVWSLREKRLDGAFGINLSPLVANPYRSDGETDSSVSVSALARITQERYSAALTALVKNASSLSQLLERSFTAPLYSSKSDDYIRGILTDSEALEIAKRMRALQ